MHFRLTLRNLLAAWEPDLLWLNVHSMAIKRPCDLVNPAATLLIEYSSQRKCSRQFFFELLKSTSPNFCSTVCFIKPSGANTRLWTQSRPSNRRRLHVVVQQQRNTILRKDPQLVQANYRSLPCLEYIRRSRLRATCGRPNLMHLHLDNIQCDTSYGC